MPDTANRRMPFAFLRRPLAPPAPFTGARWVLWIMIGLGGLAIYVWQLSRTHYFETVVLTAVFMVCLGETYVQEVRFPGKTSPGIRAVLNLLLVAFCSLLVALAMVL